MWFPAPITPPDKVSGEAYVVPKASLTEESERLMPNEDWAIEISNLYEYYEYLNGQNVDPTQWGFFKTPRYNFAVRRPLDFILKQGGKTSLVDSMGEGLGVEIIGGEKDDDEPEILLLNASEATMTEPSRAIELDGIVIVPGIVDSYTDMGLDGLRGHSGYKAWIQVEEDQEPEDTFFIPELSSHTATPTNGDLVKLKESAPDIGFLCARQLLAVASWLSEVPTENRIEGDPSKN